MCIETTRAVCVCLEAVPPFVLAKLYTKGNEQQAKRRERENLRVVCETIYTTKERTHTHTHTLSRQALTRQRRKTGDKRGITMRYTREKAVKILKNELLFFLFHFSHFRLQTLVI